ncbi:hypothetical protein B1C78_10270 [Thioalkalivibrio denitrificans]|uniref:Uncharacterized protein n=2 Tax=Thioalkalivibrio denitrificans TaxID=108003 RepID=A0A1V3NFH7_9GAMM|nr:hypothetical protein B1C78_10270 [Thioalkalivibrio denitrificans]
MKKFLLYTLLAVPVLALLMWWLGGTPRQTQFEDLPWQVELVDEGRTIQVFGITLGETPLGELRDKLRLFPSLGLFVHPDGTQALEAYFGGVKLGPFEANLVAILDADDYLLARMIAEGTGNKPMPSGARRLDLSASGTAEALALPVRELTYVPRARYDQEIVLRRFGEPEQRLPTPDGNQYWLYPRTGTVLMLNDNGRDMLHYAPPIDFDDVRERILRGEALQPLIP